MQYSKVKYTFRESMHIRVFLSITRRHVRLSFELCIAVEFLNVYLVHFMVQSRSLLTYILPFAVIAVVYTAQRRFGVFFMRKSRQTSSGTPCHTVALSPAMLTAGLQTPLTV